MWWPPEDASTCRSKCPKSEWVERIYDCVIACHSQRGTVSQKKVMEGFESRPHKAVSFVVVRDKELQGWN